MGGGNFYSLITFCINKYEEIYNIIKIAYLIKDSVQVMLGKYATTLSSDKLNEIVSRFEGCITSDIYKLDKVLV